MFAFITVVAALAMACTTALAQGEGSGSYGNGVCPMESHEQILLMEEALGYFLDLATDAVPLLTDLRDAIAAGDLHAAKAAYLLARPAYEQIEVLAPGFPDVDCKIDCRPASYDNGDGMPRDDAISDDELQGFHRIEDLLFRDGELAPALRYAEALLNDLWPQLLTALGDSSNYNVCEWVGGVAGLATEVAAKKISSEEENYSDQSTLIFVNNFRGIRAASAPFIEAVAEQGAPATADSAFLALDAADAVLASHTSDGGAYTPYSHVDRATRAQVQIAAYNLAAAITAVFDAYTAACDIECGEDEEEAESECVAPEFEAAEARAAGADYFKDIYAKNFPQVQTLVAAIKANEPLEEVQAKYAAARPLYEQIEVLAPAYPDEDEAIDARPSGFDGGEANPDFAGFHRIEIFLYRDMTASPDAVSPESMTTLGAWADRLEATYVALGEKIAALPESIATIDVFAGVIGVATEVVAKKMCSEEETFSDLSLMIFYNNWLGAYSQIAPFAAMDGAEALMMDLETAFLEAEACIAPYISSATECRLGYTTDVTDECVAELAEMRFAPYSEVTAEGRKCIVDKGYQFREAIIHVAQFFDIPAECHSFHHEAFFPFKQGGFVIIGQEDGVDDML